MNCIITGGSKGLGLAMASAFAAGGYDLYLCSRNEAALSAAQRSLQADYPGVTVRAAAADLGDAAQARTFGQRLLSEGVAIDVLINNAGSFIPGSVHNEPEGALEQMLGVNLYSAYHLTRVLLPSMMERRRGHVFTICSIASLQAYANGGAYSISKFALAGFSRNLREEMKPHGIKVTAVYPGATYTDSWTGSGVDPARIMEASDIAQLVYAASRLSAQACVEDIVVRPQLGDL